MEIDNGFARAQRLYDQQEPPEMPIRCEGFLRYYNSPEYQFCGKCKTVDNGDIDYYQEKEL